MKNLMTKRALRCAIYTRVSTDQGLEQDFNSLDAQREASEAYIKSQAHEGWRLVRDRYDDGGFSGGSMDRPALQKLLIDVQARRIDVIVVYKVDRLTRSLADFAKLVETFDAHWRLFRLGDSVLQHHHQHGTSDSHCLRPSSTPPWPSLHLRSSQEGSIFDKPRRPQRTNAPTPLPQLRTLRHGRPSSFAASPASRGRTPALRSPDSLVQAGSPATAMPRDERRERRACRVRDAPAGQHRGRQSGQSSTFISGATALTSPSATSLPPPRSIWQRRTRGSDADAANDAEIPAAVDKITLGSRSIEIRLLEGFDRPVKVIAIPWSPQAFRRKREVIQPSSELASGARPIRAEARRKLLSAIAKGRRWLNEMISGKVEGIEAIAAREGVSERSARMGLSLAFLAPDIVQAAVDGTLPRGLGVSRLMDMPPSWADQRQAPGIAPNH